MTVLCTAVCTWPSGRRRRPPGRGRGYRRGRGRGSPHPRAPDVSTCSSSRPPPAEIVRARLGLRVRGVARPRGVGTMFITVPRNAGADGVQRTDRRRDLMARGLAGAHDDDDAVGVCGEDRGIGDGEQRRRVDDDVAEPLAEVAEEPRHRVAREELARVRREVPARAAPRGRGCPTAAPLGRDRARPTIRSVRPTEWSTGK